VIHNGIFDGIGVLGPTSDNNTVEGNTVDGTVGPADGGPAGQGIIVNGAEGLDPAVITGTKTVGNVVRRSASGGIANLNNTEAEILRNTVEANGTTNVAGNGIGVQAGLGYGGSGFATRVLVAGNEVHKNAADGIQVRYGAHENRITGNNAADNAVRPGSFGSFDLRDLNSFCDSNEWSGNAWGSGFYSPPCVTNRGRGPLLAATPEGPFGERTCFDGADNDQDGIIDGPDDPDCLPPIEGPEGDPNCADGIDNDNDELIDGNDPDCLPAITEGPPGDRTCSDLLDNDRDGLYDLRDPGCQSP
ncbi:MAG: right-handed parallel beta-helix repeat-containing protein, partial [Actinobacteria bacterium]|nr:right-handed parallel beta-helix repeat-containing protein [Actinomycetota bacterium]